MLSNVGSVIAPKPARVTSWLGLACVSLLLSACNQVPQKQADTGYAPHYRDNDIRVPTYVRPTRSSSIEQRQVADDPEIRLNQQEDDDLWQQTRDNFQLKGFYDNPRVLSQREWYESYKRYLEKVSNQASPYYYHVLNQVLARNMPAEIALLPFIESAYNPMAVSPSKAAGPWQFVPGTAKHLGMRKNDWYDARRDIVDSTQAALNYLQVLADRYNGDWLLALAAYNAGEGTIDQAISRNQGKGLPTDYWSLNLRNETATYVPRLLALASIVDDPEDFGVALAPISNSPYFTVVKTHGQIDLDTAANLAGVSKSELSALNPGYTSGVTAPKGDGPGRLLVPIEAAETLRIGLNNITPEQQVAWRRYEVRRGDNLGVIAERFGTSAQAIKDINSLRSNRLRVGTSLMIPGTYKSISQQQIAQTSKVQRTIAQINTGKGSSAPAPAKNRSYKVRSGDSLYTIAQKSGMSVKELASLNKLNPRTPLKVGQTLSLKALQKSSAQQQVASSKVNYKVRNGDSLSTIADRFNVSVKSLQTWNGLKNHSIRAGQSLTVYTSEVASAGASDT
ncbi:lytic transglycosylase [Pokkaliibacter plantistimulans]|uniref:lytic transglycosylase n=1 Tax=Pokkaliibacter plantistimulans TaxID=1635171 RepID=UPI0011B0166C|nr:LysM peptidoglycan-binding domain-containing protein [Pokkaliibacter plantistimulans]